MPDPPFPARSARAWPSRIEGLWTLAFWSTLGLLAVVRRAVEPWREEVLGVGEALGTLAEYGLWALATPFVFWVVSRYPADRGAWMGRLALQGALAVGLGLLVEAVTRGLVRSILATAPLRRPWSLEGAISGLWFLDELVIALAIIAAGYARDAVAQARLRQGEAERAAAAAAHSAAERDRAEAERERLAGQLSEARLHALRAQLHPHFLFNTLNAVSALVERDPEGARTMVARLSALLRRVLEVEPTQEVPVREEAAFIRDYLDIQQVRFQERLLIEEDYDPLVLDALVPPLVLQPLVENAVMHGVARIEEGAGTLKVAARRMSGGQIVLTVNDDGPGLTQPLDRSGGVGLANTRARLDALYGTSATLVVEEAPGGGVRAEVTLPYRTAAAIPTDAVGGDGANQPAPHHV